MAPEKDQDIWPLPKFYFVVRWDDCEICFQEVSGLDAETDLTEFRKGDGPMFSNVKMPGIVKPDNITMRKGVIAKSDTFFDWFHQIKMNTIDRKSMTISLIDEGGAATMVWHVKHAFPVKVGGTNLKSDGNEVAIETLVIAHEGVTISNS